MNTKIIIIGILSLVLITVVIVKFRKTTTKPATKTTSPTTSPTTKTTSPATKTTSPATKTTRPATKTTSPATKTTRPATKTTSPATKTTRPATKTTRPATKTTRPATKTTRPATTSPAQPINPPSGGGSGGKVNTEWDYAYFYSGGASGPYTQADLGKDENRLASNLPTGADSSCGEGDIATMKKCITASGAAQAYNIQYKDGYVNTVKNNNCIKGSEFISMVGPPSGKVAVLEHGPFGAPLNSSTSCTTGRYDKTITNNPSSWAGSNAGFKDRLDKLSTILSKCGKTGNKTRLFTNPNGTQSCLISTDVLKKAGIRMPKTDGEVAIKNDGVAIVSGHGLGDGGCGALFLVQQGRTQGTVTHENPGNTILLFQIGTRAWSGEISDTIDSKSGYLRAGSNTAKSEADSQSCLQPRFRRLSNDEIDGLLNALCSNNDCYVPPPDGTCELGPNHGDWEPVQCEVNDSESKCPTAGGVCKWVKKS